MSEKEVTSEEKTNFFMETKVNQLFLTGSKVLIKVVKNNSSFILQFTCNMVEYAKIKVLNINSNNMSTNSSETLKCFEQLLLKP